MPPSPMPTPPLRNSHCAYCGARFPDGLAWPRRCAVCGNVSYVNPLPVAVVLLPVDGGLLLVRRTIAPQAGALGLPGGFMEQGESWQQAGVRELREETGIALDPEDLRLYDARSAPDGPQPGGFLLVFGLAPPQSAADLPPFVPNGEASETVIARGPQPLAFSTHTEVADRWWREQAR